MSFFPLRPRAARRSAGHAPVVGLLALLGALVAPSCRKADEVPPAADASAASAPAAEPQPEGHRRMLAILDEIARGTVDGHPYLGDSVARKLRAQWEQEQASEDASRKLRLSAQLGVQELRLGNVEAAIEHLERARDLSRRTGAPASFLARTTFTLGVAYLRLGEVENCCLRHSPESCILPIRGGGLHTRTKGSRSAIACFSEVVDMDPDAEIAAAARWLLNVAAMTLGEYPARVPEKYLIPPARLFGEPDDFPRFRNIATELGLDVFDLSGGVIADDFDGDGFLDILLSTWDTRGPMHFFRNEGDGTFADRTEAAGLTGLYGGLNMKQADYDNDGDVDVLVLRGAWISAPHPNSLLRNDGHARFTDVTFDAGLGEVHYPTQTAGWADYDNDGDLDLYIGNETNDTFRAPGQLFRNNGDGTFTDVAAAAGVENLAYAKGVTWGDYDGDRFPDLYVSNLGAPNRLYRNNGDATFTDRAPALGVTEPRMSFPAWFWDFDNDGALDLFVSAYESSSADVAAYYLGRETRRGHPRLYRGDGRGGFEDVTAAQHLARPLTTMGSNFGDLDNDGYLDFYLGTGDPDFASLYPNLMFLNEKGRGFRDITMASGFGHLQKGHEVAFADFDHDGDLDVYEQMGGAYLGDRYNNAFYENPGFGNGWIVLQLVGTRSNRSAIGARIRVGIVEDGQRRAVYRTVDGGGSFGGNPLRQTIGLGRAAAAESLEIHWPASDETQRFHDLPAGRGYRITEGQDRYEDLPLRRLTLGGADREAASEAPRR